MKIYHCTDPKDNPVPYWLRQGKPLDPPKPADPVEQFKKDPSSFFPDFYRAERPVNIPMKRQSAKLSKDLRP